MNRFRLATAVLLVTMSFPSAAHAELRWVELKTLGMD